MIVIQQWGILVKNPNPPFFPEPLGKFEPEKPDFEPEIDPDYENHLEDNCDFCGRQFGFHTKQDLCKCALSILRGEKPTVQ